jgi:hypothetical protein
LIIPDSTEFTDHWIDAGMFVSEFQAPKHGLGLHHAGSEIGCAVGSARQLECSWISHDFPFFEKCLMTRRQQMFND